MEKEFIIEFVPYVLALKLKELGFDEPCFGLWMKIGNQHYVMYVACQDSAWMAEENDGILSPVYQQAFRWFREKYNLYPSINIYNDKWLCLIKSTVSSENEVSGYIVDTINNGHPTFNTYEEAELNCVKKLIEIKEKQK